MLYIEIIISLIFYTYMRVSKTDILVALSSVDLIINGVFLNYGELTIW